MSSRVPHQIQKTNLPQNRNQLIKEKKKYFEGLLAQTLDELFDRS